MKSASPHAKLVALLFSTDQALNKSELAKFLELSLNELDKLVNSAKPDLAKLGLTISQDGTKLQLVTNTEVSGYVSKFFKTPKAQLSQANLEVLAIIAYRQPISRDTIDDIRGVSSEQTIKNLINKNLIEKQAVKAGQITKTQYITNTNFLNVLGITSINQLPKADVEFENTSQ